jgi:hypothetical protein
VKPSVTLDFLRGILFAYVACYCYVFSYTLWFGVFPRFQPLEAGASALALTIFVGLFIAPVVSSGALGQDGVCIHLALVLSAGRLSPHWAKLSR